MNKQYKFFQYKLLSELEKQVNIFCSQKQNAKLIMFRTEFDTTSSAHHYAVVEYDL